MNLHRLIIVILVAIPFFITSCIELPEVKVTAELGPRTQQRIREVNKTLQDGVNIGKDTRDVIDRINETIENGIQVGFDEATLDRIDNLLEILENDLGIEADVEIGLDAETRELVNEILTNFSPNEWESAVEEIIKALEGSTTEVGEQMAMEIKALITETRLNSEHLIREVGTEFRCNTDFLSAKAGSSVNELIGSILAYQINQIINLEVDLVKLIPAVCHITPEEINLSKGKNEEVVFHRSIIKLKGYNFEKDNLPTVYIVDENGTKNDSVKLGSAFINTRYEIHLNLEKINFASVPARSRIVFEWPNVETSNSIALIFPPEPTPTATAIPQPELTIKDTTVNIYKGPDPIYDVIGAAQKGAKYAIKYKNHDASWWQIDYNGEDGWINAQSVTVKNVNVEKMEVARFIPLSPTPTKTPTLTATPTQTPNVQATATAAAQANQTATAIAEATATAEWLKSDADGDGLTNEREQAIGTDLYDEDTDNDGFIDGEDEMPRHVVWEVTFMYLDIYLDGSKGQDKWSVSYDVNNIETKLWHRHSDISDDCTKSYGPGPKGDGNSCRYHLYTDDNNSYTTLALDPEDSINIKFYGRAHDNGHDIYISERDFDVDTIISDEPSYLCESKDCYRMGGAKSEKTSYWVYFSVDTINPQDSFINQKPIWQDVDPDSLYEEMPMIECYYKCINFKEITIN